MRKAFIVAFFLWTAAIIPSFAQEDDSFKVNRPRSRTTSKTNVMKGKVATGTITDLIGESITVNTYTTDDGVKGVSIDVFGRNDAAVWKFTRTGSQRFVSDLRKAQTLRFSLRQGEERTLFSSTRPDGWKLSIMTDKAISRRGVMVEISMPKGEGQNIATCFVSSSDTVKLCNYLQKAQVGAGWI